MDDPIRRLRVEARQLARGKVPTAVRYPATFRTTALALARPRLGRGRSLARVARDLGLPPQALGRWLRRPAAAVSLRPVALAPGPAVGPSAPSGLVLRTRQGLCVDGLDRDTLIAVLRALA